MRRRYSLAHLTLSVVVVLCLTLLMVEADAQARIAFMSHRDGNWEIYTINADGRRDTRRLTNNVHDDMDPAWFDPAFAVEVVPFAVAPTGKRFTTWGWLKRVNR
ncbi:hypothetical protein F4X33_21115 [Candidatus Poribacteria bacterium]|nr:hypothetical protein [Candidatus Poribacteria bacterium]